MARIRLLHPTLLPCCRYTTTAVQSHQTRCRSAVPCALRALTHSGAPLPIAEDQWTDAMWNAETVLPHVNALYSLGFTDGRNWARENFFVVA
jgi:hypothetical protein